MVSFVGLQENFADALKALLELEYDVVEAYEVAINKLDNKEYINKLLEFKNDHSNHIQELSNLLKKHQKYSPDSPSGKQWITKGKVLLATIIGDRAVLRAMFSNAIDTNTAYERVVIHEQVWDDSKELLQKCLEDERRHKNWLHEFAM